MKKIIISLTLLSLIMPDMQIHCAAAPIMKDALGRVVWHGESPKGAVDIDDEAYGYVADVALSPILAAVIEGDAKKLKDAIEKAKLDGNLNKFIDKQTDDKRFTPLMIAAHKNRVDLVKTLLDSGATPYWSRNINGETFFDIAHKAGPAMKEFIEKFRHPSMEKRFLDELKLKSLQRARGIQQKQKEEEAYESYDSDLVRKNQQIYGYITEDRQSDPLINDLNEAILQGKIQKAKRIIHEIVKNHVNINEQSDNLLLSPLHLATLEDHPEIVITLLRAGADMNLLDSKGLKFLDYALELNPDRTYKRPRIAKIVREIAQRRIREFSQEKLGLGKTAIAENIIAEYFNT